MSAERKFQHVAFCFIYIYIYQHTCSFLGLRHKNNSCFRTRSDVSLQSEMSYICALLLRPVHIKPLSKSGENMKQLAGRAKAAGIHTQTHTHTHRLFPLCLCSQPQLASAERNQQQKLADVTLCWLNRRVRNMMDGSSGGWYSMKRIHIIPSGFSFTCWNP